MELWDLYDENKESMERTHVRGVPLGEGEYHLISDVWLINDKQEILLTKRHPLKAHGLMWECTGGSVQAGETSLEGAVRELEEETGIKVEKEDLILIHSIRQEERFIDTYITRQKVGIEDVVIQEEEVVDAKFVTFDQLLGMWEQGIVVPKSRFPLYKDRIQEFLNPSS
ncbi:NUDIX domain-containing protein [Lacrimispora sp.]|uniref:NUDIX hydrolase n=1 Tax=Lacrimispora sp. TaxID=2719234 RepID=UPI003460844D